MSSFDPRFGQFVPKQHQQHHPNNNSTSINSSSSNQEHEQTKVDKRHSSQTRINQHITNQHSKHHSEFYLKRQHDTSASLLHQANHSNSSSQLMDIHERERRSRHWRILISIGLLLPALAGLIGIVAWAISVEVAESSQHQHAPGNGHHHHQLKLKQQHQHQMVAYQILRRQEAEQQEQKYHKQLLKTSTSSSTTTSTTTTSTSTTTPSPLTASSSSSISPPVASPLQASPMKPETSGEPLLLSKNNNKQEAPAKLKTSVDTDDVTPADQHQHSAQELASLSGRRLNYIATNNNNDPDDDGHDSDSSALNGADRVSGSIELAAEEAAELLQQKLAAAARRFKTNDNANSFKVASLIDNGNDKRRLQREQHLQQKLKEQQRQMKRRLQLQLQQLLAQEQQDQQDQQEEQWQMQMQLAKEAAGQQQAAAAAPLAFEVADANVQSSSTTTTTTTTTAPAPTKERTARQEDLDEEERLNFEAIASAISSTLIDSSYSSQAATSTQSPSNRATGGKLISGGQAKQSDQSSHKQQSILGDTGNLVDSTEERSSMLAVQQPHTTMPVGSSSSRRRSPGESVGDVIDQLVGGRRLSSASKLNHDIMREPNAQAASRPTRQGPHIVVVAPISGDSGDLKARSQVKESSPVTTSKPAVKKTSPPPKNVAPMTKATTQTKQAPSAASKKPLLGARLLGVHKAPEDLSNIKYSERVEVIQDDDSSALISDRSDFDSSIHVASAPSQPRFRSPRHEKTLFERRPKSTNEQQAIFVSERRLSRRGDDEPLTKPKLYSAEQLIREHLMRSKLNKMNQLKQANITRAPAVEPVNQDQFSKEQRTQPQQQPDLQQQQQPSEQQGQQQSFNSMDNQQENYKTITNQQQGIQVPFKSASMSSQPQAVAVAPQATQMQQQQQQAEPQQAPEVAEMASIGSQAAESQESSSVVQPASAYIDSNKENVNQAAGNQQQHQHQQMQMLMQTPSQSNSQQPEQASKQSDFNQQAAPILPDQEYNVPAHLAESVIQNIQSAPPATYGYVNGKLALLQQHQYPNQLQFQQQQQQQQYQFNNQVPQQHQQYSQNQLSYMKQAASMYRPSYHQAPNQHQLYQYNNQNQQQPTRLAMAGSSFNQARVNSYQNANPQQQQQMINYQQQYSQHYPQNQILTNRNGVEQQQPASSTSSNTKAFIHPVAQFALKHLISSIAGQSPVAAKSSQSPIASSSETQSTTSQASARTSRSSEGVASINSIEQQQAGKQQQVGAPSDLSPTAAAAAAPGDSQQQLRFASHPTSGDQEVSESNYQQQMPVYHMQQEQPAYHMAPPQQHYGPPPGNHYGGESADDKRTKGITFHFGGGPIGGGTQLITSPMGIFKHLMLPLMPNPRVNLNGKVVFGVVLEKSTAFGSPPPKKKYKFWG